MNETEGRWGWRLGRKVREPQTGTAGGSQRVHPTPPETLASRPRGCHFSGWRPGGPWELVARTSPGAGRRFSPAPPHTVAQGQDIPYCPQTSAGGGPRRAPPQGQGVGEGLHQGRVPGEGAPGTQGQSSWVFPSLWSLSLSPSPRTPCPVSLRRVTGFWGSPVPSKGFQSEYSPHGRLAFWKVPPPSPAPGDHSEAAGAAPGSIRMQHQGLEGLGGASPAGRLWGRAGSPHFPMTHPARPSFLLTSSLLALSQRPQGAVWAVPAGSGHPGWAAEARALPPRPLVPVHPPSRVNTMTSQDGTGSSAFPRHGHRVAQLPKATLTVTEVYVGCWKHKPQRLTRCDCGRVRNGTKCTVCGFLPQVYIFSIYKQ